MSQVMTVTGAVSPEQLGVTMCHVHVLLNLLCQQTPAREASRMALADKPLTMDILGIVRRDAGLVKDNLILGDIDEAIAELMQYKMAGGSTVIEVGVPGIGRDPVGLARVSRATGLNIVCSTGMYIARAHPPYVKKKSIDDLCRQMVQEITEGIGNSGIRAGAIKVAMSGRSAEEPFTEDEEKILRAAARAQARTGVPLTVHPNFQGKHWSTYLDIVAKEGADLNKFFASHMEFYSPDTEYQKSVLERGVYVSFDQFGHEEYMDGAAPGSSFPPDKYRVNSILELVKAGYANRIVLANEIAIKCGYRKYGGHGYGHVLENIVPELRYKGVTEEQINAMLVENPKRLLAV
ncbi:MAG: hypothetical protein Q7T04_07705 [Dehalococcoidia bacterium]|nr:hypothetical protein [Dehalococcoidia bacterium]